MLAPKNTHLMERSIRIDSPHDPAGKAFDPPRPGGYLACKSTVEFGLALVLLLLAAPLILLAAALVKLTSRGPAFYCQRRLGRNGRPFVLFKVRTMVHNCEKLSGPQWAAADDPRTTLVGRLLRWVHVDELPQLWNVLRGEMSLVGPRPERPEIVGALERAIAHYRGRLQVRPGLTGLAQIQLPADTDLASVRRKLAHDLYYVQRLSFWLDLRILLSTACYLAGIPFVMSQCLLRVPSGRAIESAYENLVANGKVAVQAQPA